MLFVVFGFAGDAFSRVGSSSGSGGTTGILDIGDKEKAAESAKNAKEAALKDVETIKKLNNSTQGAIANIIGWILFYIASFLSSLVSLFIQAMVLVAEYNDFLHTRVVENGWEIVRDVANNFFIVILLVIAVGTILRIPNYNRQLLPKLLIMAILINFSKMFTGIFIDFAQIIMLFFVDAIKGVGNQGNILLYALGLDQLYRINPSNYKLTDNVPFIEDGDVIKTMFFAIILSVVAVVVIAMITIILVYRIVMLWFLVILSPLAYILTTFPKGQQYAGMWWGELSKNLVMGPVMMFFLYLSFFSGSINPQNASVALPEGGGLAKIDIPESVNPDGTPANPLNVSGNQTVSLGLSEKQSAVGMFDFLIIIGLMVGSLIAGQKIGGAGASWAGKGVSTLSKMGKKVPAGLALGAGRGAARTTAAIPGARRVPIVGKRIGQAADKRRVQLADTKAKAEQERITTRGKALKVDDMNEEQLRKMANGGDKYARIAATQAMMKQGMFKDSDVGNKKAENVRLINNARNALPPELSSTFDENIKKYNPGLAHETVYKNKDGSFKADSFASDVKTGKVKAHEMMGSLSATQIGEVSKALKAKKHGDIGTFLNKNVKEKDLAEMNKGLTTSSRDAIWKNINKDSWERDTAGDLTENGKKDRDKFNKMTGFNYIDQTYDKSKKAEVDNMGEFVSKNMTEIGKNMNNITEQFVEDFGHAIDPSKFKDQAPEIKEKLSKNFEAVINKVTEGDIAGGNKDKYKKLFKNSLKSGATLNENLVDDRVDGSGKSINKERRTMLQSIMSTASAKDASGMKGLSKSKALTEIAASEMDINVVRGLSVSEQGGIAASKIAREVRRQAARTGATASQLDRADKLKDV